MRSCDYESSVSTINFNISTLKFVVISIRQELGALDNTLFKSFMNFFKWVKWNWYHYTSMCPSSLCVH
jgi:hypothetical protein